MTTLQVSGEPGEEKPSDCIYCGAPAGSSEHTILAALGGLRADRGILCGPCNQGFGDTIDASLAEDMKPVNALVGVMHGRTREPIAATVTDPATGRAYVLSGRRFDHPDALVVSDTTENGVRSVRAMASTQKQLDDFVSRMRAEGKPITVSAREHVPLLFASTPMLSWKFGGDETFRAVARLTLNVLANRYPRMARGPWLDPLKKFIRTGGEHEPWIFFVDPETLRDPGLVEEPFLFRHRFALMFDAESGVVHARVSLLGLVEFAVCLGTTSITRSESFIYDMDVLAKARPTDVAVSTLSGVVLPLPSERSPDPSVFVPRRLAKLQARRSDRMWAEDAPALVAAINKAMEEEPYARHDAVVTALEGQQQRLLNLATFVARDVRRHMSEGLGPEIGAAVGDAFLALVTPDGANRTGVTDLTHVHIEMLRRLMADHLLDILTLREVTSDELRLLLEGGPGAAVVCRYMMEQVQRTHPLSREG